MSKNELRLRAHSFQNNKHKLCINICHPWYSNNCQNDKICFFAYLCLYYNMNLGLLIFLCLCNQLFALFHYVFKFLTP